MTVISLNNLLYNALKIENIAEYIQRKYCRKRLVINKTINETEYFKLLMVKIFLLNGVASSGMLEADCDGKNVHFEHKTECKIFEHLLTP